MSADRAGAGASQTARLVVAGVVSGGVTGVLVARGLAAFAGSRNAPWVLGRAAGITAYLLMVALVLLGLLLSHPGRVRLRWPSAPTRVRLHVTLAALTLAFTALHVLALVSDRWAGVGWRGAVLPLGATYRPLAVTLGVAGLDLGVVVGVTAALAGHLPARAWWPVHKVAAVALLAVWVHGLLAGSDTGALRATYLGTGAAVLVVALSRYWWRSALDVASDRAADARAGAPSVTGGRR